MTTTTTSRAAGAPDRRTCFSPASGSGPRGDLRFSLLKKRVEGVQKFLKSSVPEFITNNCAIRRAVDNCRGDIRIPEHKLNEIRKNPKDEKMVAMFFNSVFSSIDAKPPGDDDNMAYQVIDKSEPYNITLLNTYLLGLMRTHLTPVQYDVLRMSYGLDCDKLSANDIAVKLGINVSTAHVRISQIKRDAIHCLIENVDSSQVLDYL